MRAIALFRITGLAAALMLSGCAARDINSYVEQGVNLKTYRTFDWGRTAEVGTGDPRLDNNRFFDERVRADVERELGGRGFERTSDAPDFLVHYYATVIQDVDPAAIGRQTDPITGGSYYGSCEATDCRPQVYELGTLVIDLVDARTQALVWRGWAKGAIDGAIDNQAFMEERIDEAVARILKRLP
jgi:hypothetical protein